MEQQNYYTVIPTELIERGDLTKACLYGIITSFANKSGKCWASNKTLAERLGRKSVTTVSVLIGELKDEGYIDYEIDREAGNHRVITITKNNKTPISEKNKTYVKKMKESNIKSNNNNIIINNNSEYGNNELNNLIEYAQEKNFVLQGTIKDNRHSAYNLLRKFGLDKAKRAIDLAIMARGKEYAPTINDFTQLYRKIGDLLVYHQKEQSKLDNNKLKGVKV